jgi:lysophospholipase L1-like esterase
VLREELDAHDPESQWEHWAEVELGDEYDVRNCGVPGDRTDEIAVRMDACVDGADVVVLQGGINDLVQGFTPQRAIRNLREMIRRVRKADASVFVANVLPVNRRRALLVDEIARMNEMVRELTREENVELIDFFDVLEGPAGPSRLPERWTADGVHPSVDGYRRLGRAIADSVR